MKILITPKSFIAITLFIFAFATLTISLPSEASDHLLGGKFSHTKGQAKTLYWFYYWDHRYLGNVWQAGQNWRNGSARVKPERKTANSGTMHIRLYDTWELSQAYWAYATIQSCNSCNPYTSAKISFNPLRLDPESDSIQTKVATHEFGYSLASRIPQRVPTMILSWSKVATHIIRQCLMIKTISTHYITKEGLF